MKASSRRGGGQGERRRRLQETNDACVVVFGVWGCVIGVAGTEREEATRSPKAVLLFLAFVHAFSFMQRLSDAQGHQQSARLIANLLPLLHMYTTRQAPRRRHRCVLARLSLSSHSSPRQHSLAAAASSTSTLLHTPPSITNYSLCINQSCLVASANAAAPQAGAATTRRPLACSSKFETERPTKHCRQPGPCLLAWRDKAVYKKAKQGRHAR